MAAESAGLLMYRIRVGGPEVFLVHPGGPFWAAKDLGAWSIPKGEFGPGEDPLEAACREFREETGFEPSGPYTALAPVRQKGRKTVHAWAFEGDADASALKSNAFSMEWPPRSGHSQTFPEVDRGAWFSLSEARLKINPAQAALLEELDGNLGSGRVRR
jgi:predicted NUDIX family NTP pyrophosphohydrolase